MKYKEGDKVKVISIEKDANDGEEERFLYKIKTIVDIWEDNEYGYYYGLENENWSPLYFKESELQDMRRDYVIVCFRHKSFIKDALLYWGELTEDEDKRSFGGYTIDIEKCERYTYDEVKDSFKVYGIDVQGGISKSIDDIAIKVEDLEKLGYRRFTIYA